MLDVVDDAIEEALRQGVEVNVVYEPEARDAIATLAPFLAICTAIAFPIPVPPPVTSAILDGEIVAMDASGRSSFQKLQQSIGKTSDAGFAFQIFDLVYLEGYLLTRTPLIDRKLMLAKLLGGESKRSPLRYSDHVQGNGWAFYKQACEFGIEGMAQRDFSRRPADGLTAPPKGGFGRGGESEISPPMRRPGSACGRVTDLTG